MMSGAKDTLTTTGTNGDGDMTINAGDDIYLDGTTVSADAAGTLTIEADLDPLNWRGSR